MLSLKVNILTASGRRQHRKGHKIEKHKCVKCATRRRLGTVESRVPVPARDRRSEISDSNSEQLKNMSYTTMIVHLGKFIYYPHLSVEHVL
jgi:hypothetical protein